MAENLYQEALKKASDLHEKLGPGYREIIEAIFPQLRGTEDERMSKYVTNELACLRANETKGSDRYDELTKAIEWVEKVPAKLAENKKDTWNAQDRNVFESLIGFVRGEFGATEAVRKQFADFLTERFQMLDFGVEWMPEDQAYYEDIRDILSELAGSNPDNKAVVADLGWLSDRVKNMKPASPLSNDDATAIRWVLDRLEDIKDRPAYSELSRQKVVRAISILKKLL